VKTNSKVQPLNPSTTSKLSRILAKSLAGMAALLLLSATMLMAQAPGFLPTPVQIVSTIPGNGDVNPYGVAFVPFGFPGGVLNPGDILVSNFNNNQNLQGTGTTIIRVTPQGSQSLFFTASLQQAGLSTALAALKEGLVVVGSFPTADGTCATAQNGSLLVINGLGQQVQTIADQEFINGPWDMAVQDQGNNNVVIFVANALSGNITRFNMTISGGALALQSKTTIASGYMHGCNPAALVVAPTGLVYDVKHDLLYVASTDDNAVFAVSQAATRQSDAGVGQLVYQDQTHLHGALAMAAASNGDLLVSNSDVINPDPNQPSEIVEFTTGGQFVKELPMDPNQGGSFGLNVSVSSDGQTARFAAVDDNQSTLNIWTLPAH
jgi:hypothetical protein